MGLSSNLLYSLRLLTKNLGFVAVCMLVMGLGIALSITMYSTITNIAYKVLPFPDGDRYVALIKLDLESDNRIYSGVDSYTYQYLQEADLNNFSAFGAVADSSVTLSDGEVAEQFFAANITPNLLQLTAIEPLLGRALLPADDVPGAEPVVLLSYEVWQSYYAGRVDIVGLTSRIDGKPHTVVGVMPEGFRYPTSHQLWLPLLLPANAEPSGVPGIKPLGILAEGANIESAAAEANSLMLQLGERLPEFYGDYGLTVLPYTRSQMGPMLTFHMLTAMTFIILLLVCVNVANLLAVRTNERIQELAIRSALGSTNWRLVQTVLLDSLLICLLSSLLGIMLADLGMAFIRSVVSDVLNATPASSLPFWITFDWELSTGLTTIGVVFLFWLFFGSLAAWQVFRQDINAVLASGSSRATATGKMAGSAVLVSIEIIFSCFLLVLCGAFIGTATDLVRVDYGTSTEGYLTGKINLPLATYPDNASQNLYRQNLRRQLLEQSDIQEISFVTALPSQYGVKSNYNLEDRDLMVNDQYPSQRVVWMASDYPEIMDVPLLAGRNFDVTDTIDSLPVVIIDEVFAGQIWPDLSDPRQATLGQRLQLNPQLPSSEWLTIVGVTSHIVQKPPQSSANNVSSFYRPLSQNSPSQNYDGAFSVILKVNGNPGSYRQTLQMAAAGVDRDIPITNISELTEILATAAAVMGFLTSLFSNISFVALVLAVTGIYAIVSRSVRQRSMEIGIRRALGSSNAGVLWVFIRQGLKYLLMGLVIGGGSAVLISNTMAGIFGVEWLPVVFISVSLGLGMLILFAAYNPARKLIALEPANTLRNG